MVYENPDYSARISARAATLSDEFDCRNKATVILDTLEKLCLRGVEVNKCFTGGLTYPKANNK
jgi:hypothetical protein